MIKLTLAALPLAAEPMTANTAVSTSSRTPPPAAFAQGGSQLLFLGPGPSFCSTCIQ